VISVAQPTPLSYRMVRLYISSSPNFHLLVKALFVMSNPRKKLKKPSPKPPNTTTEARSPNMTSANRFSAASSISMTPTPSEINAVDTGMTVASEKPFIPSAAFGLSH